MGIKIGDIIWNHIIEWLESSLGNFVLYGGCVCEKYMLEGA